MGACGGKTALHARGADIHRIKTQGVPNLTGKACDTGFAIGTCHCDHGVGLRAKPKGSSLRQCCAWLGHDNQAGIVISAEITNDLSALRVG